MMISLVLAITIPPRGFVDMESFKTEKMKREEKQREEDMKFVKKMREEEEKMKREEKQREE